jgi:hypothetical protein
MFQYAFASILAKKNKTEVYLDKTFLSRKKKIGFTPRNFELHVFNNNYNGASKKQLSLFYKLSFLNKIKKRLNLNYPKIFNEPFFGFNKSALNIKSPVYLNGYFQSTVYFNGFELMIKDLFLFSTDSLDLLNKDLLAKIKNTNTISVHIRRGDYVEDKVTQEFHGSCSLEYYFKAIKLLIDPYKDYTLVFFSDDTDWVKVQFESLSYPKIFVDNNKAENSWKDMMLMSSCTHNIIANSSFSWWAAWLNENSEKRVVAPRKWFASSDLDTKTLLPDEWIKL